MQGCVSNCREYLSHDNYSFKSKWVPADIFEWIYSKIKYASIIEMNIFILLCKAQYNLYMLWRIFLHSISRYALSQFLKYQRIFFVAVINLPLVIAIFVYSNLFSQFQVSSKSIF